jgi:hypothetical protein
LFFPTKTVLYVLTAVRVLREEREAQLALDLLDRDACRSIRRVLLLHVVAHGERAPERRERERSDARDEHERDDHLDEREAAAEKASASRHPVSPWTTKPDGLITCVTSLDGVDVVPLVVLLVTPPHEDADLADVAGELVGHRVAGEPEVAEVERVVRHLIGRRPVVAEVALPDEVGSPCR